MAQLVKVQLWSYPLWGAVMVNKANVVTADIMADNGVVHVIDAVILPKDVKVASLLKK